MDDCPSAGRPPVQAALFAKHEPTDLSRSQAHVRLASPSAAMHARPHDGANSSRATATGRPPSAQSAHTARGFRSPTEAPLVSCQGLISETRRPSHSSREREFCGDTLVLLGESSYDVVLSVKGYDVHFTVSGRQN